MHKGGVALCSLFFPSLLACSAPAEPSDAAAIEPFSSRHHALAEGRIASLDERSGHLLPVLTRSTSTRSAPRSGRATVLLPPTADRPFRVAEPVSDLSVEVRLLGASPSPARLARGHVIYPEALGSGTEALHRVTEQGTEDHVFFAQKPAVEALRYEIDVQAVAGLRLVPGSRTLELLDREGAPRLRVRPPTGVDAEGKSFEVELSVEGCAVDTSTAAPWGRPVTAPGAARCTVVASWSRVAYPAVIDPAWETTFDMATPRSALGLIALPDGRALAAGGWIEKPDLFGGGKLTAKAELFDPATETWAATGSMNQPSGSLRMVTLKDGRILSLAPSLFPTPGQPGKFELFDLATGKFSAVSASIPGLSWPPAFIALADGDAMIVGGNDSIETYRFHAADLSVTSEPDCLLPRGEAVGVQRSDGRVVVMNSPNEVNRIELFDPQSKTWTEAFPPGGAHNTGQLVALDDGRVALVGGYMYNASFEAISSGLDLLSPDGTWEHAVKSFKTVASEEVTRLTSGKLLVIGGSKSSGLNDASRAVSLFDPSTGKLSSAAPLPASILAMGAVTLKSGDVLVAGGALLEQDSQPTAQTLLCPGGECMAGCQSDADCTGGKKCTSGVCVGKLSNGGACGVGDDCQSGFCVDGVCCNSACNLGCTTCDAALKPSGASGTCGPVAPGTDPKNACAPDGLECGADGACDGHGACRLLAPLGAPCGGVGTVCDAGLLFGKACNGSGSCSSAGDLIAPCAPFGCDGDGCATACDDARPCAAGFACDGGACKLDKGQFCAQASDCQSGICSPENVCCDSPCDGVCETCSASQSRGTCTLRPANQPSPGCGFDECAGVCDGIHRDTCTAPKPDGAGCGVGDFCGSATQVHRTSCQKGQCTSQPAIDCGGGFCTYASGKAACQVDCKTDADCAIFGTCIQNRCLVLPACLDLDTRIGPQGDLVECAPFACRNDQCLASCASDDDCAGGYGCSGGLCAVKTPGSAGAAGSSGGSGQPGGGQGGGAGAAGVAGAASQPAASDDGCGCRVAGAPASPAGHGGPVGALGLALAALGLARRQRGR